MESDKTGKKALRVSVGDVSDGASKRIENGSEVEQDHKLRDDKEDSL